MVVLATCRDGDRVAGGHLRRLLGRPPGGAARLPAAAARSRHTSTHEIGQVYVPFVNWTLLAAVLILVFAFERSAKLAAAYGIAVTGTITITALLFLVCARRAMGWRVWQVAVGAARSSASSTSPSSARTW